MQILDKKSERVALQAIAEEEQKRRHLVVTLSGAHAYGFPSPDSDLDIKAVHIQPTREILGFGKSSDANDRLEFIDGVEIDYSSNELSGVLAGLLTGNGNYIERILGQHILHSSPEHQQLKALTPKVLSKRVYRHYKGFAHGQRLAFENAEFPSAKKLLYTLRTVLTGVHLLRTGELLVDLNTTADKYGYAEAKELIEAKQQGEKTVLPESDRTTWKARFDSLFAELENAHDESILPESPKSVDELENFLIDVRRTNLL